jgi:hypothetical protein
MPKAKQIYGAKDEQDLMTELWDPRLADDPLAFVMFAFPWGKAGTPLEHETGPRKWQVEVLEEIRDHIKTQRDRRSSKLDMAMLSEAVASGRGIGKSALVAWLVLWMMSTRLGSTTIVTANTESQLTSRTWAELGKWHTLSINGHWFDKAAMSLKPAEWFDELLKSQLKIDTGYYYAQAQLWSEEKPDAFAGVHNHAGIFVIYDEASGIPQAIWNVTKGFFTEPVLDRYWFAFSNPRNNTGAFFECFHKFRDFWRRRQIDSRTVEGTDGAIYQSIIDQHGIDSDEARVEVYGQFPNAGEDQLIPMDLILGAREREIIPDRGAPLLMGIDYGNGGHDESVIRFRQGFDGRSIPAIRASGREVLDFTANFVIPAIDKFKPDFVMLDANGVGAPGGEMLRSRGYKVISVYAQGSAKDEKQYQNKRAECWGEMRLWLRNGSIDLSDVLKDDLKGPKRIWNKTTGKLQIESKDDMKRRGLASPNDGDSLSITFGVMVARNDMRASRRHNVGRVATGMDYDILGASK